MMHRPDRIRFRVSLGTTGARAAPRAEAGAVNGILRAPAASGKWGMEPSRRPKRGRKIKMKIEKKNNAEEDRMAEK